MARGEGTDRDEGAHPLCRGGVVRLGGVRVHLDDRNEKLGLKIREAELRKSPLMVEVGDRGEAEGTVAPRWRRGRTEDNRAVPLSEAGRPPVSMIDARRRAPES